ncbi:MAG: alpha-glucosidase, partial [Bacteroidetes bacterium]
YQISSPQTGEANGLYTNHAIASQSFHTPWRVIIFGKNLGTIFESNLVHHLAAPNQIGDFSWVKPGKSSWSWWSDHSSSRNLIKLKKYVDLAKDMRWEYSLVDANWNIMNGGTITDLVKYARLKGVGLSLWYNSGGPHTDITEQPRDIMSDPYKRKSEFKKLHDWGIKAVKIDFFNSDKQQLIQLYQDILKDAADQKIMVVFHGCTIPRGWARTYPNLVAMEAVRGAEQLNWDSKYAANAPAHNIVLAFTRNVVGSMDYTPVTFSSYPCCRHATTNAYELALSVLFESGIQHFADSDSSYRSQSEPVKDFLSRVPIVWDDTKFLEGYPGKSAIIARRKGTDWYIACVNGEPFPKIFRPQLSFLGNGTYSMTILMDGGKGDEVKQQNMTYKARNKLAIPVLPNGGFVMKVTR